MDIHPAGKGRMGLKETIDLPIKSNMLIPPIKLGCGARGDEALRGERMLGLTGVGLSIKKNTSSRKRAPWRAALYCNCYRRAYNHICSSNGNSSTLGNWDWEFPNWFFVYCWDWRAWIYRNQPKEHRELLKIACVIEQYWNVIPLRCYDKKSSIMAPIISIVGFEYACDNECIACPGPELNSLYIPKDGCVFDIGTDGDIIIDCRITSFNCLWGAVSPNSNSNCAHFSPDTAPHVEQGSNPYRRLFHHFSALH